MFIITIIYYLGIPYVAIATKYQVGNAHTLIAHRSVIYVRFNFFIRFQAITDIPCDVVDSLSCFLIFLFCNEVCALGIVLLVGLYPG